MVCGVDVLEFITIMISFDRVMLALSMCYH